jgi:hypothetical protein
MADRYWVGGSGSWSSTSTAKWSAASGKSFTGSRTGTALTTTGSPALVVGMTVFNSSGNSIGTITGGSGNSWTTSGSGTLALQDMSAATIGASVPTAADNVFFDANSNLGTGAFTVTMSNSPRVCNDFTASGLDGAMTLGGSGIGLTVSGSLTFQATNFIRSYSGTTTFNATTTGKTITTNGVAFGASVVFDGVGGGWTLGSALNAGTNSITVTNGTFDTSSSGNYAVSCLGITSSNSNTRTINLNASLITCSGTTALNFGTITGLTLNAGTSQINLSGSSSTISSGGLTFYNVSFTATSALTLSITGVNTFRDLTFTGRTSVGIGAVAFSANQTINGTLTLGAGLASAYRTFLRSDNIGTPRTLTVNALAAGAADIDFRDITITGSAAPLTGTRFGNCKGNSGITFPAAKTVYYRNSITSDWGIAGNGSWTTTIGGVADPTQFPLAQDTAVFPAATYPASGNTVTINANYNIGTIDMSLRTSNTMTLAIGSTQPTIYGDWTNGTGITLTGSVTITFAGRQTQTITTAGITFPVNIAISNVNTTVRIVGNLTTGNYLILNDSTLNLNGYTAICPYFEANGSPNLTFNGGTLQFTAGFQASVSGLTTTQGSSAGKIVAGGGTSVFDGGNLTYNCTLEISSSTNITIYGSNTFTTISNTVSPLEIIFDDGNTTTVTNWNVNGTAGNLINIRSISNTIFYLSKASGVVSSDYLQLLGSYAAGGATWYAGANSVNSGINTGWIFTAPPGGGYTISADNGTYAVTGQSATLLRNKVLSGDYGLYTLTGQDAIITFDGEPVVVSEQLLVKLRSFTERRRF